MLTHLNAYLDSGQSDTAIEALEPRFMNSSGEFDALRTRRLLLSKGTEVSSRNMATYPFKPFDVRLAYLDASIAPLFSRPSPELLEVREIEGNRFFITRDSADTPEEGPPFYFSPVVCDYDLLRGHARHFPIFVKAITPEDKNGAAQPELFDREAVQSTIRAVNDRLTVCQS